MARIRTDRLVGFDTEWTCWDGAPPPGMRPELIEFGLVEYDPASREILREGRYLVRPVRSTVGPYCTALTGLTQEEAIRHGRPLGEVVRTIARKFGTLSKPSLAWGDDWEGVEGECALAGAANPFRRDGFVNVGLVYGLMTGASRRVGLAAAMGELGLEPEGVAHRGVDDARNAVRVFAAVSAALPAPVAGPAP